MKEKTLKEIKEEIDLLVADIEEMLAVKTPMQVSAELFSNRTKEEINVDFIKDESLEDIEVSKEDLKEVLSYIPKEWGSWIYVRPGWYPLVVNTHKQVVKLLPNYEIHQIKEKYGTLRYYWGTSEAGFRSYFEENILENVEYPEDYSHLTEAERLPYREKQKIWDAAFGYWCETDPVKSLLDDQKSRWKEAEEVVRAAERASSSICEVCGEPGEITNNGWVNVYCLKHGKENNARYSYKLLAIDIDPRTNKYTTADDARDTIQIVEKEKDNDKYQIIDISFYNSKIKEVELGDDYIEAILNWAKTRHCSLAEKWGRDTRTRIEFSNITEKSQEKVDSRLKEKGLSGACQ